MTAIELYNKITEDIGNEDWNWSLIFEYYSKLDSTNRELLSDICKTYPSSIRHFPYCPGCNKDFYGWEHNSKGSHRNCCSEFGVLIGEVRNSPFSTRSDGTSIGSDTSRQRVIDGTHHFLKRPDGTSVTSDKVKNGTHPFLTRFDGTSVGSDMVSLGTHPFLKRPDGSSIGGDNNEEMIRKGIHPWLSQNRTRDMDDHSVFINAWNSFLYRSNYNSSYLYLIELDSNYKIGVSFSLDRPIDIGGNILHTKYGPTKSIANLEYDFKWNYRSILNRNSEGRPNEYFPKDESRLSEFIEFLKVNYKES